VSLVFPSVDFGGLPYAVIGAVAANQYMPARTTADIDFAIAQEDEVAVTQALRAAGWKRGPALGLRHPLTGWSWSTATGSPADVISVPGPWGRLVVADAARNLRSGLPTATLPHLVALKLLAGRVNDSADITRMLGHQDATTIETVRQLVSKVLSPEDLEDLDQLIELGRLEYGPPPSL
jgi:hypothetical protein